MASVFIGKDTEIDYSLVDGRVRQFTLRGVVLFDEADGTAVDGWQAELVAVVQRSGFDRPAPNGGDRAFVVWMTQNGMI